ncbi:hypothetical protein G3N95_02430 [Paraburkholderia sp. Tr-20389]|nr:hypothetical protein [Paraburkholderia sp. Tr-20389]
MYIDCKAVGTTANLDRALQRARSAGHGKGKAGNGKPEHRVQAGLIREALMAPASLPKMLDCEALLDQLIFVSDEFRLDDIRADVIALGRKGDDYFPVLIELKAVRSLTRVLEQLERITDRLNQAPEATVAFFSAASGVDASRIGTSALRMLIWPASKSGKESHAVSIARDRGFVTIAFPIENDGRLKFQREV